MNKAGKIKIRNNKIIFVYHELEKPESKSYYRHGFIDFETVPVFNELAYENAMKEYEASRRETKVKNEYIIITFPIGFLSGDECIYLWIEEHIDLGDLFKSNKLCFTIKNNQSCEAEVKNGVTTITKIL